MLWDSRVRSHRGPGGLEKVRFAMPDSPIEMKSGSQLTPPGMAPPVTQKIGRTPSYVPGPVMNGTSHSPPGLNGAGTASPPNGFGSGPSSSNSSSSSSSCSSSAYSSPPGLPLSCGARQLSKLKRFLTTLQQFGSDISPEIGERVRTLVLGLVNSTISIEDFHSKLQEATNFPLRPFVIPFLKANLPLLQRELLHCARLAKQTPAQYLALHERALLHGTATTPPLPESADGPPGRIEHKDNGKRSTPDRAKENGLDRDGLTSEPAPKRVCSLSPLQRFSPGHSLPAHGPSNGAPGHLHHTTGLPPPPQGHHHRYGPDEMAPGTPAFREAYGRHSEPRDSPGDRHRTLGLHTARQEEVIDHRLTDREWAEEWKHLDNLLNCILDMVEKTRRALTVMRRCQEADREELGFWVRRYSNAEELKKDSNHEFFGQTSTYLPEDIWRKAEEAVNEVKRQAVSELQKAVTEAERKAHEMIAAERAKMDRAVLEAKRKAADDAASLANQQEDSSENCWNCGRKASETCSGCNAARYCGSFCQHKDWERHHHACGSGLSSQHATVPPRAEIPITQSSPTRPVTSRPSSPTEPASSTQAIQGECSPALTTESVSNEMASC
uniref:CBFA2/RUNX1 partner transcriptional co-repressor 3 n=1 Tax=Eptatretus burgeri TaxID=7764 RepID=A0A8C4QMU9_EPTBU